jgi:hypothetical protein
VSAIQHIFPARKRHRNRYSPYIGQGLDLTDPTLPRGARQRRVLPHAASTGGQPIVFGREARRILNTLIEENNHVKISANDETGLCGGIALICERASQHLDATPASITRRLYDILQLNQVCVRADLIDAFLSANNADPSYYPTEYHLSLKGMIESVEIEAELKGKTLTQLEVRRIAHERLTANRRKLAKEMAKAGKL